MSATDPTDLPEGVLDPEQETFDVADLPGGARAALEAVLMVVEEPVSPVMLATALDLPVDQVEGHLHDLAAEYDDQQRGFALLPTAGGWRFYSRHEHGVVVEKFLLDGQRARLTQAALETLAVVAYRQPVTRARVSAVRGVNVDGVVRTLLTRGLITEIGVDGEHGAVLYGTTPYFLQRLGLASLEDLPPLAPYLPDADSVEPDPMGHLATMASMGAMTTNTSTTAPDSTEERP